MSVPAAWATATNKGSRGIWIMSLILKCAALSTVLACGLTGCMLRPQATAYDPMAPEPPRDSAMAYRSFPESLGQYDTETTTAYSTRFYVVDSPEMTDPERFVAEPVIFVGNLIALPV